MTTKPPLLLVYVAGPYRSGTAFGREENIFAARKVGAELVTNGFMPVIPHANTAHFDGLNTDDFFLEGTLEMMRRCDVVFLIPGHEKSSGARAEKAEAANLGIPVVDNMYALELLLQERIEDEKKFGETLQVLTNVITRAFDDLEGNVREDLNNDTDA